MFRNRSNPLDAAPGVTRLSKSSRAEEPAGQAHKRSENASGGTIGPITPAKPGAASLTTYTPASPADRDQPPAGCDEGGLVDAKMREHGVGGMYDRSCCDRGFTDMILQVSAGSSWLVRGAAALVLSLHITAAGVGILSGATALLARKGSRLHRRAGNWFLISMLTMSGIGASVAPFLPQRGSVLGGVFTFYLVATSWVTVRRKEGSVGHFEIGALLVALGVAVTGVTFGVQAANSPTGLLDGIPPPPHFVFAAAATLAAALDLRMILRGGVFGAQRIARHLWRMCVALLIATTSFFLGQPQVFPASVRGSPLLFVPEIVVLGLLIFWLIRVLFTNWFKHNAADRRALGERTRDPNQAHGLHD